MRATCAIAADDIRTLLAIACVGDTPEQAERYKALYSDVLRRLEQLSLFGITKE